LGQQSKKNLHISTQQTATIALGFAAMMPLAAEGQCGRLEELREAGTQLHTGAQRWNGGPAALAHEIQHECGWLEKALRGGWKKPQGA
jgi:hypothetical protein